MVGTVGPSLPQISWDPLHPRYVRVSRFVVLTGYTAKAVYHKIADGIWLEGRHYRRAPDGNICIDLEGYDRWVEGAKDPVSSR